MIKYFSFLLLMLAGLSCTKDVTKRTEVYFNDFENRDVKNIEISNAQGLLNPNQIVGFNGNKVLGQFNNGAYVQITVGSLPRHNRLKIEFDLYIHDKWTGNSIEAGKTQPDLWVLSVDQSYPIFTTFSNTEGQAQCFPENYSPDYHPFPARGNAWEVTLPGACALAGAPKGTTLYKVDLFQQHAGNLVRIAFTDQMQTALPLCEKSWSVDNVRITAMEFF
jgi:hypothetical protein